MKLIKNKIKRFYSLLSVVLNFVIIFNLVSGSFHELQEHKHSDEEICSPEFEKDACHRYLIHHEESTSCNKEHKHINEKTEDCFGCKYYKERQNDLNITNYQLLYVAVERSVIYTEPQCPVNSLSIFYTYLRGPPAYAC
jgi:hypothetical protein